MINREITYERTINKSYMKIPACVDASFDETMMLKKEIQGFLSVEKCYINGSGQYWYNITGMQALDNYIKMKLIGISFVEKLLLNICSQLERLEWNLLDTGCLVLDPEMIFVVNGSEEICFTLYPENKGSVFEELTKLIEYLLTKLDHKDTEGVRVAYSIYELTLAEGYSISDIRMAIEKHKEQQRLAESAKLQEEPVYANPVVSLEKKSKEVSMVSYNKLQDLFQKVVQMAKNKWSLLNEKNSKEDSVYEIPASTVTPTVCLVAENGRARGVLLHEGKGCYPDYEISEGVCRIGNHPRAHLFLEKDTISVHHASVECIDGKYYIEDLNSTNGTFVNELPVNYKQRMELKSGDRIRIADVRYKFL